MKTSSKILRAFMTGGVITFIFLCIFSGGVDKALQILLMSIICTAGIGLGFWVAISIFVGAAFWGIVNLVRRNSGSNGGSTWISPDKTALMDYITNARSSGLSESAIQGNLQSKGWSDGLIQDAFNSV